ncbi:hypothetical protein [Arthrobacter alpinus]|uniref:hypothetical protein n=1 Tax=Arthrobacter alpinus TaxID=656366 RepID=UPI00164717FE|nr:hypothetical protein [Arthrobacter alpinus]
MPSTHATAPTVWSRCRCLGNHERARKSVIEFIGQARAARESSLVTELASLDMMIHSVERADGSASMGSRRDTIAGAAARRDPSVEEFAAFLEAMVETIIWPED